MNSCRPESWSQCASRTEWSLGLEIKVLMSVCVSLQHMGMCMPRSNIHCVSIKTVPLTLTNVDRFSKLFIETRCSTHYVWWGRSKTECQTVGLTTGANGLLSDVQLCRHVSCLITRHQVTSCGRKSVNGMRRSNNKQNNNHDCYYCLHRHWQPVSDI